MHDISRRSLTVLGVALLSGFGLVGASRADDRTGPHGGALEMTKHHHFEVVLTVAGFKVFPYGMDGKPLDATTLSGKATFYHSNSPNPWFDRPLGAGATALGRAPESLDCTINLSKVPSTGVRAAFEINGLSDPAEPTANFTVPFVPTQAPQAATVRRSPATLVSARATRADQPAINAQRVCKVSREPLGSMGMPIKVSRGNSQVFLCCQGCLRTVQANPDRFLGAAR